MEHTSQNYAARDMYIVAMKLIFERSDLTVLQRPLVGSRRMMGWRDQHLICVCVYMCTNTQCNAYANELYYRAWITHYRAWITHYRAWIVHCRVV